MRWEGGNVELHSDLPHTTDSVRMETVSDVERTKQTPFGLAVH